MCCIDCEYLVDDCGNLNSIIGRDCYIQSDQFRWCKLTSSYAISRGLGMGTFLNRKKVAMQSAAPCRDGCNLFRWRRLPQTRNYIEVTTLTSAWSIVWKTGQGIRVLFHQLCSNEMIFWWFLSCFFFFLPETTYCTLYANRISFISELAGLQWK